MKFVLRPALTLAIALAGCLPSPQIERGVDRPPKRSSSGTGTPVAGVPPGSPTETPGPPIPPGQLVPRSFPPPHSYGPQFPPPTPIPNPVQPLPFPPDAVNVLLLGSDRRSGRAYRTDTIIVASIHPQARAAALLSIPRDLYVYLPGYNMQRINAALPLGNNFDYPGGGRAMLSDTILYNLGIPIHYYAQVDMDGFRRVIDHLGGIEVHATCSYTDWRLDRPDLNPQDADNWSLYTVPTGVVQMDGDLALWYARSRARSSDFDRARRQQEVLRAVHRRALRLDLIPKIPELYGEMLDTVSTDMSLTDLIRLAPQATRIRPSRIRSRFIGRDQVTSWRTPTGGAVLLPEPQAVRRLLEQTFDFERADPIVPENPTTVEVVDATTRDGWPELAAERLTYAGFEPRVLRMQAEPSRTHLIDYGLAPSKTRLDLLSALGLPAGALTEAEGESDGAAFRLVVGNDFDPCFNPTRNQR